MEKLNLHSPDLTQENIVRLAQLFPNCVTEVQAEDGTIKKAIDFDQLRQELSDHVVDGPRERYHLNWPGKREALLAANAPIAKTLRPCREESVDFDTTKNLFIEGDNLDALKLLQETYLNKVKMIYIDPPYNTGNDFIYNDDFSESAHSYFERSLQLDDCGNRLQANTDANGRFHSDWLSMIYPRLKLARNLLCDTGVIFISIDDDEVGNLRKVCDEVMGAENFVANVIWQKKYSPQNDARYFSDMHDHILVYCKIKLQWQPVPLPRTEEQDSSYSNPDNDPRGPWKATDATCNKTRAERPNLFYAITNRLGEEIYPKETRVWAVSQDLYLERERENRVWWGVKGNNRVPAYKSFLSEVKSGRVPTTIWSYEEVGHNQQGKQELNDLVVGNSFNSPKPTELIKHALRIASRPSEDDVIVDFFAGSGTTAQAVMALNAEDGGRRRFVMVQLPEPCVESSEAFRSGLQTIADISKERIRRAGRRIKDDAGLHGQGLDIGFRVLKVDTSNMKDVYYKPDGVKQGDLLDQIENIKEDRNPEDLLFQVLLDWGVDLSLPIAQEQIDGKTVFFVDQNALAACFDKGVTEALVKKLAARKPLRVVFRDAGFSSDAVKINAEQIFKLVSPGTEVKAI